MEIIKNKSWGDLRQTYSWVSDMEGVPQDARHHAEGDVAVHTRMVLDALNVMPAYQQLEVADREVLWTAALMHDIEKRSTTFTEADGRIVSPGHAKKGALTTSQVLFTDFDLPFYVREQIVALVRYHGLPLWLMHKPDPLKALLESACSVNTAWLCLLARADMLGRLCNDQAEMLDRIDFFEAYCEEQGCLGRSREFVSDTSRFHYFSREGSNPGYLPYESDGCEVILMSGLPGMGKDHYIQRHFKDLPVISLDAIRQQHKLKATDKSANGWVAQQAKEQARAYLRARQDFIWNATNITRQMRSQLIGLFADYGARITIVYVEQPFNSWLRQNRQREESVPVNVMYRLLQKLEVPSITEAHRVVYAV